MDKTIIFLILFYSLNLYSQNNLTDIKNESLQIIKKINRENKNQNLNDKLISELFCQKIMCVVCNEQNYDENFLIENRKIKNNINEIIPFLNPKKLKKSAITYDKDRDEYSLGYQLAKPNPKTKFEGSGALLRFKKENGKLKIFSIETIP